LCNEIATILKIKCHNEKSPCSIHISYKTNGDLKMYASLSNKEPSVKRYDLKTEGNRPLKLNIFAGENDKGE
jgi:hypothetical protein